MLMMSVATTKDPYAHAASPVSPKLRPKLRHLHKVTTFSLPAAQVSDLTQPTSAVAQTPTSEILKGQPLRVLIAPSGFKESLGPEQVADAIEAGITRVLDRSSVIMQKLPLHDGGEGFAKALVAARNGIIVEELVSGPIGELIESHLGFMGENKETAVLDMAAAAGLRLVPKNARDPTVTTTFGVGQLMRRALDEGSTKIIIGCGDSGTSDGGAGMLQALGVRLLDAGGNELPVAGGGRSLTGLASLDWHGIHPRLRDDSPEKVNIEAVCNIENVLCGPKGVARVYGPQKGATPAQADLLATALERLALVAEAKLGRDISYSPGSGASGGLGTGLMLLGAQLRARGEAIDECFEIDHVLDQQWDFVITAEGSLDFQSPNGKMTTEIARRARRNGAQVVALAGTIGEGADGCYGAGIKAFTSILRAPLSLDEAIRQTEALVEDGAEKVMRMIMVGLSLGRRR